MATDENPSTAWYSNYSNNQWITVDLGETVPINLVVLQWGVDYGKKYEIQVSDDLENWTTIYSESNGNGGIDFIPNLTNSGRYIKMNGIERNSSRGYILQEFKIFSVESRATGTLKDIHSEIMRGTPMVLGKNLKGSVEFATNLTNWETIKNNGFNTIRICWVDPWYKMHNNSYWNVSEMLSSLDKCVHNATASGMNIIINFHNVGAQQEFDTEYTFEMEKEFWDSVAPRYKNNDLVYYEIANEPTFQMNDYLKPLFKNHLLEIYHAVREKAPERQILMFSFNTIANSIVDVVEDYRDALDWEFTSVAYHMYNSTSSTAVQTLMAYHRVICTEWNYNFVQKNRPDFSYIKQVDGFKENSQTLENIGSSWIDWRDWSDTTLNELLDTLIYDAKLKNYWWAEPKTGVRVTGVKLSGYKLRLNSGETKQLTAMIFPSLSENQNVTWSSSDDKIVSVNQNGLITAAATQNKQATVTVTTMEGEYKASCEVQVIAPEKKGAYPDGAAHSIPGEINPTHYDLGGENIGYHDFDASNSGDGIRQEQGVDTEYRLPEGTVGGIQTGEWLEYTIFAETEGYYTIEIDFATTGRYGKFHIEFDAEDKTGEFYVHPSGSYSAFLPTKIEKIWLKQGTQIMRLCFDYAMYNLGNISIYSNETTGTENIKNNRMIMVYPNPVNERLFVSNFGEIKKFSIKNVFGQTVLEGEMQNTPYINLQHLLKGNYFIFFAGRGFIQVEKIIKI